jgi:alpha-beta hydrolase superfamily lysophospholipase
VTEPRLVPTHVPARPQAAVLVLHGGAERPGDPMVSPAQLSVLRMVPIARRIARAARHDLAVFRVLNSARGWDSRHTPVDDAVWAMGQVRARLGELPVGLVGHSLGGRAALLAGGQAPVRAVVALNPWVYPTDAPDLRDRRVLVVHGSDDRVALPERARTVVATLEGRGVDVEYVEVPGGRHAMLRHGRTFGRLATGFVVPALVGQPAGTQQKP